jgi:phosphatidylserine decarboxylase
MNVGKITLSYTDIVTNKTFRRRREHFYPEGARPAVGKGEELGIFQIGSTVVVLFQEDRVRFEPIEVGRKVRVGDRIATFRM